MSNNTTLPITRDRRNLLRLPLTTPLAALVQDFLSLLASPSPQGVSLRQAFRPAYLSRGGINDCEQVDEMMLGEIAARELKVVVARGAIKGSVANIWMDARGAMVFEDGRSGSSASSGSAGSGNTALNPFDVIFLPCSLHDALEYSETSDSEQSMLRLMTLACLAHEVSHWFAVPPSSATTAADEQTLAPQFANFRAEWVGFDEEDWGTASVEALFGHVYTLLTYSDGTFELVSSQLSSSRTLIPLLSLKTQMGLLGKLPPTLDASRYGKIDFVGQVPPWRQGNQMWVVADVMEMGKACHHLVGARRSAR